MQKEKSRKLVIGLQRSQTPVRTVGDHSSMRISKIASAAGSASKSFMSGRKKSYCSGAITKDSMCFDYATDELLPASIRYKNQQNH